MTIEEVRIKAQEVSTRVKSDPTYRDRIQADPVAVLQEAGIPDASIPHLIRENMGGGEVQGYNMHLEPGDGGCNDRTCIVSFCPESCYITIPSY
jgi:hypothetical protein